MENTKVNISQAARLVGKDRKTIHRHMKEGKPGKGALSFVVDDDGRKFIDVSELQRFYGEIKVDGAPKKGSDEENPQHVAPELLSIYQQQIVRLEKEVEDIRKDKEDLKQDKENHRKEKGELLSIIKQQQTLLLPAPAEQPKKRRFLGLFGR